MKPSLIQNQKYQLPRHHQFENCQNNYMNDARTFTR